MDATITSIIIMAIITVFVAFCGYVIISYEKERNEQRKKGK